MASERDNSLFYQDINSRAKFCNTSFKRMIHRSKTYQPLISGDVGRGGLSSREGRERRCGIRMFPGEVPRAKNPKVKLWSESY